MGFMMFGAFSHILRQRPSTDGKRAPVTAISMKPGASLPVSLGSPAHTYRNDEAADNIL